MGYPVTLDNSQQLAKDQANEQNKILKERLDAETQKTKDNHAAWAGEFQKAEQQRRTEEKNWRKFYADVYDSEKKWYHYVAMFALNGVQLWALTQQYKQQKEIASHTYELANRQLKLAEQMYSYYKEQFQPHEAAMSKQLDNYFANPYRPQYDITAGRFALNARMQMIGKRRDVLLCASEYCTGATTQALQDLALQEATLVSNAMNSAIKYEKAREIKMEQKWLNARLAFVQAGRDVAAQGITGIDGAVSAFHSLGADPGAALSQLLSTFASTVGGLIPDPVAPRGGSYRGNVSSPYIYTAPQGRPSTSVHRSY